MTRRIVAATALPAAAFDIAAVEGGGAGGGGGGGGAARRALEGRCGADPARWALLDSEEALADRRLASEFAVRVLTAAKSRRPPPR
jgi:hypothetical protein